MRMHTRPWSRHFAPSENQHVCTTCRHKLRSPRRTKHKINLSRHSNPTAFTHAQTPNTKKDHPGFLCVQTQRGGKLRPGTRGIATPGSTSKFHDLDHSTAFVGGTEESDLPEEIPEVTKKSPLPSASRRYILCSRKAKTTGSAQGHGQIRLRNS